MTEDETIDFINNIKILIVAERERHLGGYPPTYMRYQKYVDMCDMAIDSLNSKSVAEEYRTPKKPIPDDYGWIYHCPTCDHLIDAECNFSDFKYCPTCGQALDWSEVI